MLNFNVVADFTLPLFYLLCVCSCSVYNFFVLCSHVQRSEALQKENEKLKQQLENMKLGKSLIVHTVSFFSITPFV